MAGINILTFGSCLSRYIARSYKRLFAGEIVGSVYHNRSDYFTRCFIERTASPLNEEVMKVLIPRFAVSQLDEDSRSIVANQTASGIGRHKLEGDRGLMQTLSEVKVDLILVDNFMDVAGRLSSGLGMECFLRPHDYLNYHEHFSIGGYIPPLDAAKNFLRILEFFSVQAPDAKIYFIHFPFNTYEGDNERRARSHEFAKIFKSNLATIIPPLSVPKIYRTEVASHFQEPQYAAYAGMIRALQFSGM